MFPSKKEEFAFNTARVIADNSEFQHKSNPCTQEDDCVRCAFIGGVAEAYTKALELQEAVNEAK